MTQQIRDFSIDSFDAVLFDLDGVLTQTADIHAKCWKTSFDEFLEKYGAEIDRQFAPFDIQGDYARYVDGKPRYDGVRSFLESRQVELPYGEISDSPDQPTICGVGNRKNQLVNDAIERGEVETFPSSIAFVQQLREHGVKTAVVSSSKNCRAILNAVSIAGLFQVRVDGVTAAELGLPGKPAPDTFLKAAEMLAVSPKRAVVVEDAIAGVESGHAGGFGLVIGVDRLGQSEELAKHGADIVVQDLGELLDDSSL